MRRLLAIGLDAASAGLIDDLAQEGHLPHLSGLARGSRRAVVTNPDDYRAELPWTSFWTGRTPAANRYWGTVRFDPATYGVAEAGALRARPFFAGLGRPVLVVDLPHCPPWPGVDGVQVAAWGAHSPQVPRSSSPAGLVTHLDRLVGAHPAFEADSQPGWHSPLYLDRLVDALATGATRRAEAARWLAGRVPDWGLALVVFSETHSAGHHLWHGVDPGHPLHGEGGGAAARTRLARVYAAVDAAVGRLLSLVDADTTVAVFSVHGMRTNANDLPALHLVPELLHRLHGRAPLLAGHWGGVAGSPRVPPPRVAVGDVLARAIRAPVPRRARDALRRVRVRIDPHRPPWYHLEDRPWPEQPADADLAERSLHYLGTDAYRPFWSTQRIFALPSFSDTHLRLNLAGREAAGLVAAGTTRAELDRWESELAACTDPRTGRPVAFAVSRPGGTDASGTEGPPADLVIRFRDVLDVIDHPRAGRIGPVPFLRTGEHDRQGFLLVRPDAGPVDLAPCIEVEELGRLLTNLPGLAGPP